LIIMVFGPGKWALDTILGRFFGVESGDTRSV
jgi:hypothetical protein